MIGKTAPEHDPEKHALGLRPDGCVAVFPLLTNANAFAEIMLSFSGSAFSASTEATRRSAVL
jgi:hypothetical protein